MLLPFGFTCFLSFQLSRKAKFIADVRESESFVASLSIKEERINKNQAMLLQSEYVHIHY